MTTRTCCDAICRIALLAALGVVACARGEAETLGNTARVEHGSIERVVVATGTVEPENEIQVRARASGIIERIYVEAGNDVEAGAPLLQLERELLDAQLREARAALDEAKVDFRLADTSLERVTRLQQKGAASQSALDEARARSDRGRAVVTRAAARLQLLEVQLGYTTVAAPIAGRVLDVHQEEGNSVSAVSSVSGGSLLFSLAEIGPLHLQGLVDENEVARVRVGQTARIRTEAFGERFFRGRVREIAPVGNRLQNVTYFEVEIEITDEDAHLLRPRMSGEAEIVTEVVEDGLLIPETALRYDGNRIYVETIQRGESDRIVAADVEVGIVDGDRVQVLSGLKEGAEVLVQ